jgi:hypothetical protein
MSAPGANKVLVSTWNITAQLAINAVEDLRNGGRATYVSRQLGESGMMTTKGECWELQKGSEKLLLAFKAYFGQETEVGVPMNPDAENVITLVEGDDLGVLGAWGSAMSEAVGPGDVCEMIRGALHAKGIPVDSVDTGCSVTAGNMNRLERVMQATFGECDEGSLGSYPDLVGSREVIHLNCGAHTIASRYGATLPEHNVGAIWAYKKPEIVIEVTAGGVTLRMPVKLRVTGAAKAKDFNVVASGCTERTAMAKAKMMGVGLLTVDLRGGGGGGNEEIKALIVSGMREREEVPPKEAFLGSVETQTVLRMYANEAIDYYIKAAKPEGAEDRGRPVVIHASLETGPNGRRVNIEQFVFANVAQALKVAGWMNLLGTGQPALDIWPPGVRAAQTYETELRVYNTLFDK